MSTMCRMVITLPTSENTARSDYTCLPFKIWKNLSFECINGVLYFPNSIRY